MPADPDPLSQIQVEMEIMRLSGRLTEQIRQLATISEEAAQAKVEWKYAVAVAVFGSKEKTALDKEADATIKTRREHERHEIAEARRVHLMEAGRNLRAQLDALRSINTNLRDAVTHAHGTGG